MQKIFDSVLVQPDKMTKWNVSSVLMSDDDAPPQGLLIILVLVLLRCLGDQVYGLLKRVARHGRHSAYQLPAL